MYKKINDENGIEANVILRTTDNTFIPKDNANTDYQEYLAWIAEGNTPEEAE